MKKLKLPELGRVVVVRWDDITTDHGWTDTDGKLALAKCTSVGIVTGIADDKLALTLASMYGASADDPADHGANVRHTIPTGCITSWAYLVEEPAKIKLDVRQKK